MSSNAPSTNLGDLPQEIRDMIWKLVLANSEHRKLHVEVRHVKRPRNSLDSLLGRRWSTGPEISVASMSVPSVLHVCRESRLDALSHFDLVFKIALGQRPIYFDSASDILVISGPVSFIDFYSAAGFSSKLPIRTRSSTIRRTPFTQLRYWGLLHRALAHARGLDHVWSLAFTGGLDDWTGRTIKRCFPALKRLVLEKSSDHEIEWGFVDRHAIEVKILEKAEFERWVNSGDL